MLCFYNHTLFSLTDKNISSVQPVSSDLKASRTPVPVLEPEPQSDVGVKETSAPPSTLAFSLIVSMIVLIVLCLILAAVVSRCRKRGRLFRYEDETVEFSKLIPENEED